MTPEERFAFLAGAAVQMYPLQRLPQCVSGLQLPQMCLRQQPDMTAIRRRMPIPLRSRCSILSVPSMWQDGVPTAASAAESVPQGIPLHLLNRKFIKDIDHLLRRVSGGSRYGIQRPADRTSPLMMWSLALWQTRGGH